MPTPKLYELCRGLGSDQTHKVCPPSFLENGTSSLMPQYTEISLVHLISS